MSPLNRILAGFRRHKLIFGQTLLAVLGATWLVLESVSYFSKTVRSYTEDNLWVLAAAVVLAILVAVWRSRAPEWVKIAIPGSNAEVELRFGDLFARRDEHIAIAVGQHFDGGLGLQVAPDTVHGQFIRQAYNGSGKDFEDACDSLLRRLDAQEVVERKKRKRSYQIGTAVAVPLEGRKAFVFALARTDPETFKASADVPMMGQALSGLWKCVRDYSNGNPVNIPLVGDGQSGVGLEPAHLLRLLLLSIQVASREGKICKCIRIVLHPQTFDQIDLLTVKNEWS